MGRGLLSIGIVSDIYALSVGNTLFRGWAMHNDEPKRLQGFRDEILEILASISR